MIFCSRHLVHGVPEPTSPRIAALTEPVVDTVESDQVSSTVSNDSPLFNQVVTTSCLIKEVELQECLTTDIDFDSRFHLQITRDANMNALVLYFKIHFTRGLKRVEFSTAPEAGFV
jgi:protein arginine N-methyltransferase 1